MTAFDRQSTPQLDISGDRNATHTAPGHGYILLCLLLAAALVLLPGNSDRLLNGHEILVAQTATEMIERDDLLVPHLMGEPRMQKPPLSYWLSVAAHRVLGAAGKTRVTEFEARLPSLLSGLLLLLLTYGIGRLLTREARGGLLAAGLLAGCYSFYLYSRSARPEMLYTLLCATIVFGFLLALRRHEEGSSTRGAAAIAWAAFGLALMAKGPQFPVFILLGILITLLMYRSRLPLTKIMHPGLLPLALIVPLAYFAYLGWRVDGAVSLWGSEVVQNTGGVPLWMRPLRFYYPAILVVGLFPWIILFGIALAEIYKRREPAALMLVNCVLVALLLVSFSGKLRAHYVLPLLPLCVALIAWSSLRVFNPDATRDGKPSRSIRYLFWSQWAVAGISSAAIGIYVTGPGGGTISADALGWLLLAAVLYVAAAIPGHRHLGTAFFLVVASILFADYGYARLGIDSFANSREARRFIGDVEARVPADARLYLDSGDRLFIYYYGTREFREYRLERWLRRKPEGAVPYFITRPDRIEKLAVEGEWLVEKRHQGSDEMVLFRPSPLPAKKPDNADQASNPDHRDL